MNKTVEPGLYIIATPIGNLGDISARAIDILKHVDVILAEDTRMTARLLSHYHVETPMRPYNDHNAAKQRPEILEQISRQAVALVSDAGTPLISDPGYKLVAEARDAGLPVTTAPGPSAAIAALSIAGLPSDRFFFAGFPPPKSAARKRVLMEVAAIPATLIFYESPKRLEAFLKDIAQVYGNRSMAVARELTKLYEEVLRGSADDILSQFADRQIRGEIVVLIGPPQDDAQEFDLDAALVTALQNQRLKEAVAQVTAQSGLPRKQVYARALELNKDAG